MPGQRYHELAKRCHESAASARTDRSRTALIRMAEAYERKAAELERRAHAALTL